MSERAEFLELADEEKLTIDQLLTFRRPETSHAHLLERVTELLDTLGESAGRWTRWVSRRAAGHAG